MKEHLKSYTELRAAVQADANKVTAELRYHGLVDIHGTPRSPKDKRSRAQREGRYSGHVNGRPARDHSNARWLISVTYEYYAPTRKARKQAWIDMRKSFATK